MAFTVLNISSALGQLLFNAVRSTSSRGTYPTQTPPSAAASILVIHSWEAVSSLLYDLSPALEVFQASSLSPTIPHGSL